MPKYPVRFYDLEAAFEPSRKLRYNTIIIFVYLIHENISQTQFSLLSKDSKSWLEIPDMVQEILYRDTLRRNYAHLGYYNKIAIAR